MVSHHGLLHIFPKLGPVVVHLKGWGFSTLRDTTDFLIWETECYVLKATPTVVT